jgi:hypothetical protein
MAQPSRGQRKPAIRGGEPARSVTPATLFDQSGTGTLDELITATWAGLAKGRTVRCPVCSGQMVSRAVDPVAAPDGDCTKCGATLS